MKLTSVFMLFAVALGAFLFFRGTQPPEPVMAQATPPGLSAERLALPLISPSTTPTPTNTPVPTAPAWVATEGAIRIAAANVDLAAAHLSYDATAQAIALTQEQGLKDAADISAQKTQQAQVTATLQAQRFAYLQEVALNDLNATATIRANELEVSARKGDAEITLMTAIGCAVIIFLLFVGSLMWRKLSAGIAEINERRAAFANPSFVPENDQPIRAPERVVETIRDNGQGFFSVIRSDAPLPDNYIQKIKKGLDSGLTLSYDSFTPLKKGFSRGMWDYVREHLVPDYATIADTDGTMELTDKGRQLFGIKDPHSPAA